MKCPKYIEKQLKRRTKAALMWNDADFIVSDWCDKHGIDTEEDADLHNGVEAIVNPESSSARVLKAIQNHKEEK